MRIEIPYGRGAISAVVGEERQIQLLQPVTMERKESQDELLHEALHNPYGSPQLAELAKDKQNAVIITSDHTRPVPSYRMMPLLLSELRRGNPSIDITLLIAAGCHRPTTREELEEKFGTAITASEKIKQHDASDAEEMEFLGQLPSGMPLWINRTAVRADLLIAEGFIEPHFFAGFSGGRKSILPGVAGIESILCNHNSEFIDSPYARAGSLNKNPIHADMQAAADMAGLRFILNVVLDDKKEIVAAFAGAPEEAHRAGCAYSKSYSGVSGIRTPIVLTSNGGYPLDQNIYQCVKGLATAEQICVEGGVLILCAACADGHGGTEFYRRLSQAENPETLMARVLCVPAAQTAADQWQYQILARILCKYTVILVTRPNLAGIVEDLNMRFAPDIDSALRQADKIVGENAPITVIPDGVSTFIV